MIKAILFDLDDTLLDFHAAEAAAAAETLRMLDLPSTEETVELYSQINRAQWKLLERGVFTRQEIQLRRFDVLFNALHVQRDACAADRFYEDLLAAQHPLLDGAAALLETLYLQYRLFAASNGRTTIQRRRLREAGLLSYFESLWISEDVGAEKPSKVFFDRFFTEVPHVVREESVIIGDSMSSDICGGRLAGMHTIWFHPGKQYPQADGLHADAVVQTLAEIPAVLKTL